MCRTPKTTRKSCSLHNFGKRFPGYLAASDFLEGCGRAAGHPERQESLSPYNIGKRFHGHLAALDPVESCSRAARHPKWQGNLGLYKFEAILAIWRLWTSWKAAGELADPRNDKEISFCIARGRDYPGQLTALDLLEGCR